jgi:hypothetical protein
LATRERRPKFLDAAGLAALLPPEPPNVVFGGASQALIDRVREGLSWYGYDCSGSPCCHPLYRLYKVRDRWFFVATAGETGLQRLAGIAGLEEIAGVSASELSTKLEPRFASAAAEEWVRKITGRDSVLMCWSISRRTSKAL